ncbi:MAG: hypothetical protein EPO35_00185 [Acidobacteria bacterium]|nr:MAG: hypothetical protein EPO35_00185 [Acidobacteriota bacterium]
MRHHIDVLGLLHMVWGVFAGLAGVSLIILAAGTNAAVNAAPLDADGSSAAVWLLGATGVILLAAGLGLASTGRRLRRVQAGARQAALVLAVPNLLILPFGTALGVYTYWVLLNNDARDAFGRPQRAAAV